MTQRSLCSISSTQGNNGKSSSLLDILNSFGSQFIPLVARKGKKKRISPGSSILKKSSHRFSGRRSQPRLQMEKLRKSMQCSKPNALLLILLIITAANTDVIVNIHPISYTGQSSQYTTDSEKK